MAPPPNTPSSKPSHLIATYTAPPPPPSTATTTSTTEPPEQHIFSHTLSSSLSGKQDQSTPAAKTAYLSELRGKVTTLQDEINAFLTAKMEEDKLRQGKNGGGGAVKEEKEEEENYGEELGDVDEE
ncbi:hypothetical protein AJ80_05811 [Polytolypa hystricis UAMH7299]|uniref:EKC/KEOPS complex subunit GON7 n=1 Tax=Polytolypa hystricis (strain UAMH7299) TaxID=1447883 RepID=A0A2B7Y228_POLH7|nr:hypothetical protein AJ80_05811 [Polytolypa hystricis UAMH7299]